MTNKTISRKETTKWNLLFYYLRLFIGFVKGILIIPLYLKFIDHDLFGAWLATGNILTWITIVDPGVGDVLIQRVSVAYGQNDKLSLKYLIPSALIISSLVASIALTASIILSFYIGGILNLSQNFPINDLLFAFQINAIATCLTLFSFCLSGTIIGFQRTKEIGLILTITGVLGIILNVYLLFQGFGLVSIAYGELFKSGTAMVAFIVFIYIIKRKEDISFGFNKKYFFSFSKIFSYTFFSKLFNTLANNIDLIIISRFVGSQAVLALELTRRPIKVVQSFVNAPSIAILPAFASLFGDGNNEKMKQIIKRFLNIFSWILFLFIAGFITFNKDLIFLWVGDQFFAGNINNLLICLYFLILTLTYNLYNFTYSMGNIKGNSLMEIFKNTLYIILLFVFGKYFGITGVILASLISILLSDFWYYPVKIVQLTEFKLNDLKDLKINSIKLILVSAILCLSFLFIKLDTWPLLILCTCLFSLIYLVMLYFLNMEFRKELYKVVNYLHTKVIRS